MREGGVVVSPSSWRERDFGYTEPSPRLKPGLFRSWRECAIKLMLAVLVMACLGAMVVWAMGPLRFGR